MAPDTPPETSPGHPEAPEQGRSAPQAAQAADARELVQKLAGLARLELQADELAATAPHLERILQAFQKLEVATLDPPAEQGAGPVSVLREDEPCPSLAPDEVLRNAPERHEDFYGVPKTIGGS